MRIHVSSLGCKLNQSEMETLAADLAQVGHQLAASPDEADVCVLNTCAVTHVAAQKSRQSLRRLHRENPEARLIATGCYAELAPDDLRDLPGIELVAGNQDKANLATLLSAQATEYAPAPPLALHPSALPASRTRALVKIQDGCDNACTYCIIHVARGQQQSRPADQIVAEVQAKLAAGYKEIVLTGVHIGAYGRDLTAAHPGGLQNEGEGDLWSLAGRLLAETGVPRLRLSSIEPWDLSGRAFPLWQNPRLCRHLHLPLQNGSDAILRRMARRYTTAEFQDLVDAARRAIPDMAVTTDLIVGFPGETEAEFAESKAFVQAMGFARIHVFPYSLRPGTPAARMPDQIPPQLKTERARLMRTVATQTEHDFRQRFVGRTMQVLWEAGHRREDTYLWKGLTDNYLRVQTESDLELGNSLTPTRLVALTEGNLRGKLA